MNLTQSREYLLSKPGFRPIKDGEMADVTWDQPDYSYYSIEDVPEEDQIDDPRLWIVYEPYAHMLILEHDNSLSFMFRDLCAKQKKSVFEDSGFEEQCINKLVETIATKYSFEFNGNIFMTPLTEPDIDQGIDAMHSYYALTSSRRFKSYHKRINSKLAEAQRQFEAQKQQIEQNGLQSIDGFF